MPFLVLILELLALYILSRHVTQSVYTLLLLVFRTRTIAVPILLVLEFPGTVVHELSHLFTAGILGVRTGKLQLEPESIREEQIKAGSVAVAESDPFRKYIIGLAPLVWGLVILSALAYFIPRVENTYVLVGVAYLMFAVSNTMFSSRADLSGFAPFALVLCLFIAGLYFLGIRVAITGPVLSGALQIATTLTKSLGIVIAINISILVITWLITVGIMKLLRVRIVLTVDSIR